MASIKVILRKKANADGTHPIVMQIIKDRKSSIITLGHHLKPKDWDSKTQRVKKAYPNAARLNNMIAAKVAEANAKLIELETINADTSSRTITNAYKATKEGTFFKLADAYCKQLQATGKFNRVSADKPRIERFREFLNGSDINFSEINPPLLKKFKAWLKGTRSISDRTIVNHLVVIRTIYNQAISNKLVDPKYYPFGKAGIVIKFPDTLKIGLNIEDVQAIEKAEIADDADAVHARNLWLFSFYFAGMRISDVLRLKWSDFHGDRLFYKMGKNEKGGSLKVPEKAMRILAQYHREKPVHDLVFPDLEKLADLTNANAVQCYIKTRVKSNNHHFQKVLIVAGIKKKVTMHIARHSFGNIAKNTIAIPTLQQLFRHSDMKTTHHYMANFIHNEADAALEAVIGI